VSPDCEQYRQEGHNKNGVYPISPDGGPTFDVYCTGMLSNRRGNNIIQRRHGGDLDFNRTWADYVSGFGNLTGEFWLGLDKMHRISTAPPNDTTTRLIMRFMYIYGRKRLICYLFGSELGANDYSFNTGKSVIKNVRVQCSKALLDLPHASDLMKELGSHPFTTLDHGASPGARGCARDMGGGWWYPDNDDKNGTCSLWNLNAQFPYFINSGQYVNVSESEISVFRGTKAQFRAIVW
jgi:hypothetical protein